jgi:hypothetical protein
MYELVLSPVAFQMRDTAFDRSWIFADPSIGKAWLCVKEKQTRG